MQKTICYTKLSDWRRSADAVVRDGNNVDHWLFLLDHLATTRPVYGDDPGTVATRLEDLPLPTTIIAYPPKEDPAAKYWDEGSKCFRKADKCYLTASSAEALIEGLRSKLGAYRLKHACTGTSIVLFPLTDERLGRVPKSWDTVAGYQCPLNGYNYVTVGHIMRSLSSGEWQLK